MDTQTAILVSTGLDVSTGYLNLGFNGFWACTAVLGFPAWGQIFPKAPVTKIHQLRIKPYRHLLLYWFLGIALYRSRNALSYSSFLLGRDIADELPSGAYRAMMRPDMATLIRKQFFCVADVRAIENYSQHQQKYQNNIIGPTSVKNYLNNSQNHLRSVNRMSVILQKMLERRAKPKLPRIIRGRLHVGNWWPEQWPKW